MARILGPNQRRVIRPGTLVAGTLTAVDVNFGLSELGAVLITAIDATMVPGATTDADDGTVGLILRPDYTVITTGDSLEPWNDPDFLAGFAVRMSILSTTGGGQELKSFYQEIVEGGVLLARRASALFFSDEAANPALGIWFKRVILTEEDLVNLVIAGRR